MSSLNGLNLPCVGELAVSTMVKLHQKQMVVPLSVERLNVASRVDSRQSHGHKVKDKRRTERVEK